MLLLLGSAVDGERRGAPTPATPFSTGEQALFGQSHSEDCLFGYSSSSVFHVPPVEEEESTTAAVQQVKATSDSTKQPPAKGSFGFGAAKTPTKPAFVETP